MSDFSSTIKNEWLKYRKWFEKQTKRGFKMTNRSLQLAESIDLFDRRYKALQEEYRSGHKFDNTILNEMKARSFVGGTNKQVNFIVGTIRDGMEQLKKTDPEIYAQLYNQYGSKVFEMIDEKDFLYRNMRNAELMAENGPTWSLFYALQELGINLNMNSPK